MYVKRRVKDWVPTHADEIWALLGVIVLMGFHRLPSFALYWSSNEYVGVSGLQKHMTKSRFIELWRNFHVVDNGKLDPCDKFFKVRPIVSHLKETFVRAYHPGQELALDETMIKSKGRAKGKVYMPNKPIKRGFKMYSLSCSCCGYLCDFELCAGKEVCRETATKPGKVRDTVKDLLVDLFSGSSHVVYMDRYFTSAQLVKELSQEKIYTVGSWHHKEKCTGFSECTSKHNTAEGGLRCGYIRRDQLLCLQ